MRKQIKILLALGFFCAAANPVYAEDESKRDTEVLKRQLAEEKQAAEFAEKSSERSRLAALGEVTYDQILADPDNTELNFRFAKSQVANNDLLGASATLERILILNPDLHAVRLFFAVVLFRLDNLAEAERELGILDKAALPANIRSEVDTYQKLIRQKKKLTYFSIRQSNGFGMETNRNAAPSSKRRLVRDVPIGLNGSTSKQRDTNFMNVTSFDVVRDLGMAAGHEIFGNFTYFLQEQTKVDSLDLGALQYELGSTLKSPWFHFVPSFSASHVSLSRESFMRTQAGNFELKKSLTPKIDIYSAFKIERQDPLRVTENLNAPERKGTELSYRIGGTGAIHPKMRLGAEVFMASKSAEEDFNAYERMMIRLNHVTLLGKGQYVVNSVDGIFDYYDEIDRAVANRHRRDKGIRYRVSYGAPLTTLLIGKILPKMMKDITLSLSYEYYRSLSTITNNTYTNNKFQGLLSKKWEF